MDLKNFFQGGVMEATQTADLAVRDAAKKYQGSFAWPTVLLGIAVTVAYAAILVAASTGQLSLVVAAILTAPVVYAAYTVLHEAAHGTIAGSRQDLRWVNEALGYVAGWIMMIPLTAHRHEHLSHHRNTNDPDDDPDHLVSAIADAPWRALPAVAKILASQYRFYIEHRWHKAPRKQNVNFCIEVAAAFGLRIAFMALGFWDVGVAVFLVGGLAGVFITMYLFAYIVHRPHSEIGRYVDTSAIEAPAWCNSTVTWLWLFQNYHAIHHLFPRIPFFHYRRLFTEVEAELMACGTPVYDLGMGGLSRRALPLDTHGQSAQTAM